MSLYDPPQDDSDFDPEQVERNREIDLRPTESPSDKRMREEGITEEELHAGALTGVDGAGEPTYNPPLTESPSAARSAMLWLVEEAEHIWTCRSRDGAEEDAACDCGLELAKRFALRAISTESPSEDEGRHWFADFDNIEPQGHATIRRKSWEALRAEFYRMATELEKLRSRAPDTALREALRKIEDLAKPKWGGTRKLVDVLDIIGRIARAAPTITPADK